ncbi:YbjQ family protein [Pseudoalteromonas sp. SK18]|uniref:YbjQ family protein n=1 Tax=Pseudoalteromonas sp. SK18 TaxID=1938366 RepID=UPI000978B072|nr:YbjQ family protein [Pseudoalteromonas sp. SK18]
MFLSDNHESKSSSTKTEWTLNDKGLTNNFTETTYEINCLSFSLKKDGYKGVASIFYNNDFLCNLTTLYSQAGIYKRYGIKESIIIDNNIKDKLLDISNNEITLSSALINFKSKDYGIAGLRTVECDSSYEVLFYGKYVTSVSKETAHKIETTKDIYLKKKLSASQEKSNDEKNLSEVEKKKNDLAASNYKIIRTPNEVILTTETASNLKVLKRLDVITAECAYGMNIFKDLFASISDIFGGRNKSIQNTLKDARKNVLAELQKEAFSLGANAVVGIDLDYSEISGGGKFGMLFIVASGTAVIIER